MCFFINLCGNSADRFVSQSRFPSFLGRTLDYVVKARKQQVKFTRLCERSIME